MKKYRWIILMAVSAMLFACHTTARSEENGGKSTKNQEAAQVSEKPEQTKSTETRIYRHTCRYLVPG